jgi:hypothetical protein
MNWGKGLALVLVAFAGLMAWFIVMSARNPEPLVTEHYYEQELKYQQRINNTERANALSTAVIMRPMRYGVLLTFPAEIRSSGIAGVLTLLRPNDPKGDRTINITPDSTGRFLALAPGLTSGRYNAQLEWTANGTTYYTEEKLVVP